MSVADNVKARTGAEESFQFVVEHSQEWLAGMEDESSRNRYWLRFKALMRQYGFDIEEPQLDESAKAEGVPPLSDEQKDRFECRRMTFGKYKGELVKDVPLSYLVYLDENRDDFMDELPKYLRRSDLQREQANAGYGGES